MTFTDSVSLEACGVYHVRTRSLSPAMNRPRKRNLQSQEIENKTIGPKLSSDENQWAVEFIIKSSVWHLNVQRNVERQPKKAL